MSLIIYLSSLELPSLAAFTAPELADADVLAALMSWLTGRALEPPNLPIMLDTLFASPQFPLASIRIFPSSDTLISSSSMIWMIRVSFAPVKWVLSQSLCCAYDRCQVVCYLQKRSNKVMESGTSYSGYMRYGSDVIKDCQL